MYLDSFRLYITHYQKKSFKKYVFSVIHLSMTFSSRHYYGSVRMFSMEMRSFLSIREIKSILYLI